MMVPWAVLFGLIIWLITFYTSRYVSLASILAAVTVMVSAGVLFALERVNLASLVYCVVASTVVIIAHRANISRLRAGTENRFGTPRSS
jgi:glycerol-3-phosphate acyltransferase PlsY